MNRDVILVLVVWLMALTSLGQDNKFNINWTDPIVWAPTNGVMQVLNFEGAQHISSEDLFPLWFKRESLAFYPNELVVDLTSFETTELTSKELELVKNYTIPQDFEIKAIPTRFKKRPYAKVILNPVRRNPSSGRIEKIVSFSYNLTPIGRPDNSSPRASAASNSVLATGKWVKMGVIRDGIYKLDYNKLSDLGFNPAQIDPRKLSIYGYGGGMLPENTSTPRYDDLRENAIKVVGELDGSFDQDDYIIFFAQGAHGWKYQSDQFYHQQNIYADTAYYFLTLGQTNGLRVSNASLPGGAASVQITDFIDRAFSEQDLSNLVGTGRQWFGEYFDITDSRDFEFPFANIITSENAWVNVRTVARSSTTSGFSLALSNGTQVGSWNHSPVSGSSSANYVSASIKESEFLPSSNSLVEFQLNYNKLGNPSAVAWLDYIEVNVIRELKLSGSQMMFRNPKGTGTGLIAEYTLQNATNTSIWNITDPTRPTLINEANSAANSVFKFDHSDLHEFVAFKGSSFYTPVSFSEIANQDLHGMISPKALIITSSKLKSAAQDLADFHASNGWTINVVTTNQIYNEFSSGRQDLSAIRDFLRMHYMRGLPPEDALSHVILYGDASYDYKEREPNNTNHVPTWESQQSFSLYVSYPADDYLFMLDDDEGASMTYADVDLSFGRIVANNLSEGYAINEKIKNYTSSSSNGNWVNDLLFVADDVNEAWESILIGNSEELATKIDTVYPRFNVDKIYLDAYVQESTPAGQRYPDAKQALRDRIEKGVLLVNYIGHGGELGWAHERVLENSDILSWTNFDRLTNFLTVTCEFSRFDDPKRVSAGEYCLLNPNGAGVSLFSTSRVVYVGPAHNVNRAFYNWAFEEVDGRYLTNGELMMYTKNDLLGEYTRFIFTYLGDPLVKMPHPKEVVNTLEFDQKVVDIIPDTISAFSLVKVKGEIRDENGQKNFNGELIPTVYDKKTTQYTRVNNGVGSPVPFDVQKNIIYKGRASVENGEWSFEFMVPKDIAYQIDYGKISFYAHSADGSKTAQGLYTNFLVGGTNANPPVDEEGPSLELYMNDFEFVNGGTTDEDPDLLVVLEDQSGINTIGNGIGHDLIAILDGDNNSPFVLNEYYTSNLDSYQSGTVRYPFFDLEKGTHNLRFKAFDSFNNSSEASLDFIVAESAKLALSHVLNYPNPFTTYTEFHFEHNRPGELLLVQVQIFTVSGKLVKTINTTIQTEGFRVNDIVWDGRDDFGDRIGKGTYIYKVEVRSSLDNSKSEKFEKLVILQ